MGGGGAREKREMAKRLELAENDKNSEKGGWGPCLSARKKKNFGKIEKKRQGGVGKEST